MKNKTVKTTFITFLLFANALVLLVLASCNTNVPDKNKTKQKESPAPLLSMNNFFKNGNKATFQISPDGNYFSYRADYKGMMNIFVQKISDTVATRITNDTLRSIGRYFWKGNRVVFPQDIGGDENFQLFSVKPDGSDLKALTPFPESHALVIDDLKDIAGKENELLVGINKRDKAVDDPYLLNVETGELTLQYANNENYDTWVTDNTGRIRMAAKPDGLDILWAYRSTANDVFTPMIKVSFYDQFTVGAFDKNNKNLYVLSNIGRDKVVLAEYDPLAKKEVKEIYANKDYDLSSIFYDRKIKELVSVSWSGEKPEKHFFNTQWQAIQKDLDEKFETYTATITAYDNARTRAIVAIYNDRKWPEYYIYNFKTKTTQKAATPYPWCNEKQMSHCFPISYLSRDGLLIHGYLTLPLGLDASNLPVLVNPHGGPWSRDEWGINPEAQFFANRGYAVLQINFRGSTGYGKSFYKAGFKQWGKKMQNDITDGVKCLIKAGIADSNRIAIYGSSYGGNAALFGLTLTPDLYAAGVADVAASNMFTFIESLAPEWGPYIEQFYQMVGDPNNPADSAMLAEISPLFNTDKIKAPLFISCGANDPRVNRSESDQLVAALKKRGVTVEYMVKENEGHGFNNQDNLFDYYGALEKFLNKYVKNK